MADNITIKGKSNDDSFDKYNNVIVHSDGSVDVNTKFKDSEIFAGSNEGDNIRTSNVNQEHLLNEILKQLKITNLHLSILTDNTIKNTEVQ